MSLIFDGPVAFGNSFRGHTVHHSPADDIESDISDDRVFRKKPNRPYTRQKMLRTSRIRCRNNFEASNRTDESTFDFDRAMQVYIFDHSVKNCPQFNLVKSHKMSDLLKVIDIIKGNQKLVKIWKPALRKYKSTTPPVSVASSVSGSEAATTIPVSAPSSPASPVKSTSDKPSVHDSTKLSGDDKSAQPEIAIQHAPDDTPTRKLVLNLAAFPDPDNCPVVIKAYEVEGSDELHFETLSLSSIEEYASHVDSDIGLDLSGVRYPVGVYLTDDYGLSDGHGQQVEARTLSMISEDCYRVVTSYHPSLTSLVWSQDFKTFYDAVDHFEYAFVHNEALTLGSDIAATRWGDEYQLRCSSVHQSESGRGGKAVKVMFENWSSVRGHAQKPFSNDEGQPPSNNDDQPPIQWSTIPAERSLKDEYYSYFAEIKDAATGGDITEESLIPCVYITPLADKEGRNRIGRSRPQLSTQLLDATVNGKKFDSLPELDFAAGDTTHGYGLTLYTCFTEIDEAPAICFKVTYRNTKVTMEPIASCFYEVPFTGAGHLSDFTLTHGPQHNSYVVDMAFTCYGASRVGGYLNLLAQPSKYCDKLDDNDSRRQNGMNDDDRNLIAFLGSLVSGVKTNVKLRMWHNVPKPNKSDEKKKTTGSQGEIADDASPDEVPVPELDPLLKELFKHIPGTPESREDDAFVPASFTDLPFRAYRNSNLKIEVQSNQQFKPWDLMRKRTPASMTPFQTGNTFRDIDAARVKLAEAVNSEYYQDRVKLNLFSQASHRVTFLRFGDIVMALVQYGQFAKLKNSTNEEKLFRLSNGTKIELEWFSKSEAKQEAKGIVISPPCTVPDHGCAILITDRKAESFGRHDPNNPDAARSMARMYKDMSSWPLDDRNNWAWQQEDGKGVYDVKLTVRPNETVYKNQMMTINLLTSAESSEWHPYLLNQQPIHDKLDQIDATRQDFDDKSEQDAWNEKVEAAYSRLLAWSPCEGFQWNDEQLQVIQAVRNNIGKLVLVTGIAGTGKTEVQQAVACFFHELGYHVLFDAPAHSNVTDFIKRLDDTVPGSDIVNDLVRVAPRSAESGLAQLATGEKDEQPAPGDFSDRALFDDLAQRFQDRNKKYQGAEHHQIRQLIYDRVMADEMSWKFRYGEADHPDPDEMPMLPHGEAAFSDSDFDSESDEDEDYHEAQENADSNPTNDDDDSQQDPQESSLPSEPIFMSDFREVEEATVPDGKSLPDGWICKVHPRDGRHFYLDPENGTCQTNFPDAVDDSELDLGEELKKFFDRLKQEKMRDWKNEAGLPDENAKSNFLNCIGRAEKLVVANTRMICTTSAGSNSKLIRNNFASAKYGSEHTIGVVIIKEEAAKDTEANFWGSIINCNWRKDIVLALTCGDPEQLQPVVTGDKAYNRAQGQLTTSFFTRLVDEGSPRIDLVVQSRMHSTIAMIPAKTMYVGRLKTDPRRCLPLEDDLPGLYDISLKPLYKAVDIKSLDDLSDAQKRVRAIAIPGTVRKNPGTGSRTNQEQVNFVLEFIVPRMREYFRDETYLKCLIIAGYAEEVGRFESGIRGLRKHPETGGPRNQFPNVQTIDSSQGSQAKWVVVVSTVTKADKASQIGFMRENRRINTAITRAQDVLHYVHGPFQGKLAQLREPNTLKPGELPTYLLYLIPSLVRGNDQTSFWRVPKADSSTVPAYLEVMDENDDEETNKSKDRKSKDGVDGGEDTPVKKTEDGDGQDKNSSSTTEEQEREAAGWDAKPTSTVATGGWAGGASENSGFDGW